MTVPIFGRWVCRSGFWACWNGAPAALALSRLGGEEYPFLPQGEGGGGSRGNLQSLFGSMGAFARRRV